MFVVAGAVYLVPCSIKISGVRSKITENRGQKTDDSRKGADCFLSSVI